MHLQEKKKELGGNLRRLRLANFEIKIVKFAPFLEKQEEEEGEQKELELALPLQVVQLYLF